MNRVLLSTAEGGSARGTYGLWFGYRNGGDLPYCARNEIRYQAPSYRAETHNKRSSRGRFDFRISNRMGICI